jgi:hypothetical protein
MRKGSKKKYVIALLIVAALVIPPWATRIDVYTAILQAVVQAQP